MNARIYLKLVPRDSDRSRRSAAGTLTPMTDASTRPPSRERGGHAASAATRGSILDAALEVFAENGFRSGSLRLIAGRVGMSEAGLLHHFPSKKALLMSVLERRREAAFAVVPRDPSDGAAWLRGIIRLAEGYTRTPSSVRLFCVISAEATSAHHPAHAYFVERYETLRDELSAAFDDLRSRGMMRDTVQSRVAATTAIALMDGLQVQWLLDPQSVDLPGALRTHFSTIVDIEFASA
jgi:AcrR family transcriptional regulator